jgi:hypothetical protein
MVSSRMTKYGTTGAVEGQYGRLDKPTNLRA